MDRQSYAMAGANDKQEKINASVPTVTRAVWLWGALWLVTVLAGCGPQIVYDYAPPQTPEGRACAIQCHSSAALCRQMQQNTYQQCQNTYNLMLQNYNACRENGGKHCSMPSICSSPSTSICDQNYRECFAACGGKVTSRVVESA
jgi:hypothetical protein